MQIWLSPNNNPLKGSPYCVLDLDEMCHNLNIGFVTKHGVQGSMKPRECL
jgi:hypothetical protein